MQTFIFGGDGMPKTPQELERMRAVARAMGRNRTPQNVGEGIASIGDAILYRAMMSKADRAEKAGLDAANSSFADFAKGLFPDRSADATATAPDAVNDVSPSVPSISSPQDAIDASPQKPLTGDLAATEAYIRESAKNRGIDPDIAVRVARSEGLAPGVWQSRVKKNGMYEPSFGPFQMLVGDGKNFPKGLGNDFMEKTGLDPRDPKNVNAMIDFALDTAKRDGWRQWHGAKNTGIQRWAGINANQVASIDDTAPAAKTPADASEQVPVAAVPDGFQQPDPLATSEKPTVKVAQAMSTLSPEKTSKAMTILNDPWATPGQKAVAQAYLKRHFDEQDRIAEDERRRNDPKYKLDLERGTLDLEKGRLELQKLKNPDKARTLTKEEEEHLELPVDGVYQMLPDGTIKTVREPSKPIDAINARKAEAELKVLEDPPQSRVLTAEEKQQMGLPVDGSFQIDQRTGKVSAIGGGNTNIRVDTGTIPPGYKAIRDESGNIISIEPLPGSKQAQEAAEAQTKADLNRQQTALKGDIVSQDIDRAIEAIDASGLPATASGSYLSWAPGTNAKKLAGLLDTIKANVSFDTLNQMRQASPTGGALGSITENELKMLQATLGSLDQSQDEATLKDNLNRVWNVYQDIVHGPGNGPERRALSFDKKAEKKSSTDDVPEGISPEDWKYMTPEERKLWQN
ncbi:MAG: hypothetical protein H6881_09705 [Rhodobiaceae bacterium]|nr:hypothetical protein [Rhodobiaceae bacterium]